MFYGKSGADWPFSPRLLSSDEGGGVGEEGTGGLEEDLQQMHSTVAITPFLATDVESRADILGPCY